MITMNKNREKEKIKQYFNSLSNLDNATYYLTELFKNPELDEEDFECGLKNVMDAVRNEMRIKILETLETL